MEDALAEARRAERNVAVKQKKVRCSRSTMHRVYHRAGAARDPGALAELVP